MIALHDTRNASFTSAGVAKWLSSLTFFAKVSLRLVEAVMYVLSVDKQFMYISV